MQIRNLIELTNIRHKWKRKDDFYRTNQSKQTHYRDRLHHINISNRCVSSDKLHLQCVFQVFMNECQLSAEK